MSRAGHDSAPPFPDPAEFAGQITRWLDGYPGITDAMETLRSLETEPEALRALLDTSPGKRLRLSWELWDAVVEADGASPETLLAPHLGEARYASLRYALWGDGVGGAPTLSAVD